MAKNKKETTVVVTIEATFVFKDGKVPEGIFECNL